MSARRIVDFSQDWHVHSRFSDGTGSLEDNVAAAERLGLTLLGCVDHVRSDSSYVPAFAAAVEGLRASTEVKLIAGIEAKLLDDGGTLDLPGGRVPEGIDAVVIADHQVPSPEGPCDPHAVRKAIAGGDLDPAVVVDWIVVATVRALARHPGALLAHLFSVLPKTGLALSSVTREQLTSIVRAAARSGATLEVSERWRTPSSVILSAFARAGVRVVASTDAHRPGDIGRYRYCRAVVMQTDVGPPARYPIFLPTSWRAHSIPPP
ncbi:MAG: PHP domain-containing protein [Thermoleophilia bacterium]|nr:PHP domain-containing protein [Thermoleophilia bacterium]